MTLQSPTATLIPLFSSSELTGCGYPGLLDRIPRHPRALRDNIICIFNMLYERVDDVMVPIYSINVMWLYLFACIFSILEWSLLILTRITYRFKQCNWRHLDAAADATGQCHRLWYLCINSVKIHFKVCILLLFAKSGKGTFWYVTGNVTGCNWLSACLFVTSVLMFHVTFL